MIRYDAHLCIDEVLNSWKYETLQDYYKDTYIKLKDPSTTECTTYINFYTIYNLGGHIEDITVDYPNIKTVHLILDPEDWRSVEYWNPYFMDQAHNEWIEQYFDNIISAENVKVVCHFDYKKFDMRTNMEQNDFLRNIKYLKKLDWEGYDDVENRLSYTFKHTDSWHKYVYDTLKFYDPFNCFNENTWDKIVKDDRSKWLRFFK